MTQLKEILNHFALEKFFQGEQNYKLLLDNLIASDIKGVGKIFKDHKDILSKVSCSEEDLRKKKQYLLVSKLDKNQYSFAEMKALIGDDDVESWVLDAVSEGIIQAKIDQSNDQVVFRS